MPSCRAILASLLALLLAACGDLPRPFQPDDKSVENPLLVLGDRAGIVVMPLAGVEDEELSQDFAEALAKALRDADVIAHNGAGNRASLVLSSFLERKPGAGAVVVLWLSGPDGSDIGTFEANVVERDLAPGAPRRRVVLQRIAESVAAQVNPAGGPGVAMPPMAVARISGLPAAQATTLERAMASARKRRLRGAPARRGLARGPLEGLRRRRQGDRQAAPAQRDPGGGAAAGLAGDRGRDRRGRRGRRRRDRGARGGCHAQALSAPTRTC